MDIKELINDQIVEVNGEKWVISKLHKTCVPFQVKLLDIPFQIIERYKAFQENNLVFPNPQLLVNMQAYGKDDKGMRHHQEKQLSPRKARVCAPGSFLPYEEQLRHSKMARVWDYKQYQ